MERKTIILLIVEALIFTGIFFEYYNHTSNKEDIYKQNLIAAHDTIDVYKLKNNDLLFEKSLYISTEESLRKQLNVSKKELKELKKKVGELELLVDVNTEMKIDTIHSVKDSIIYINNDIEHRFGYKDKWMGLDGITRIKDDNASTTLYNIYMNAPLTIGLSKDYKFIVTTPNPYLNITSIEGSILENSKQSPKKSRWSQGIGFGLGFQYGFMNKSIDFGPQFGYYIKYEF